MIINIYIYRYTYYIIFIILGVKARVVTDDVRMIKILNVRIKYD